MTQKHVWEYVRCRARSADEGRGYALKIFNERMPAAGSGPDINWERTECFQGFEDELGRRGQEMVSKPRNQQFPTKLPGKFALLAAAYGTGKDDYLAVVLGIDADAGKLVTWTAYFDFGPMADDRVPCGSGHYFDYRDSENNGAAEEAIGRQGCSIASVARARRDKTLERAWADFFVRSTSLLRNSVHWVKVKS